MGARVNAGAAASGATAAVTTTAVTSQAAVRPRRMVRAGRASSPPRNSGRLPQMYSSDVWAAALATAPAGAEAREAAHRDGQVGHGHATQGGGEDELACGQAAGDQQRGAPSGDHHPGQRDRDGDLQHRLVAPLGGQDGGQRVVDDLRGGVQQVQQIADDPQPGLDQGDPPPGRRLDKGIQARPPR